MTAHGLRAGRRSFGVMSCSASVVVVSDGDIDLGALAEQAVARSAALEQRWSRFLSTSELMLLNRRAGEAVQVSADTVSLVESMVRGWHATDHCYDPTLLGTLLDLGYSASRDDATVTSSLPQSAHRRGQPAAIGVDPTQRAVMLPAGTAIDPGGIGKGLAADLVAAELIDAGACGALVEIGGDLAVVGTPPAGDSWTITADTGAGTDSTIALRSGGVATSTTRRRTWRQGDADRHHLVDPVTLAPSATGCIACTVIAGTAAWAEVFTKVAFARPLSVAIEILERRRLAASLTTDDGRRHVTAAWKEFAR